MNLRTIARDVKQSLQYANKNLIRVGLLGMVSALILIMAIFISPLTRADNVTFNSARDCDSNAVMHCGAMTINELNTKYDNVASTRHIYDYFDITGKDINNMKQFAKSGKVNKNGNVTVDGKIVATNARTAGRLNIAGSTRVTHQGTTFYTRTPSVSFLSNSLDAYVIMENGAFSYAILASCGNPVSAKATAHPAYQLDKTVRNEGGSWKENVDIKYGETVEFRVVVKNTGNAPVTNLHIRDRLPSQLTYVAGTLLRDGDPANATNFFSDTGVRIGRLPKGDSVVFRFKATTTQTTQPEPCTVRNVINRSHSEGSDLPAQNDNASVDLLCTSVEHHPNYRIEKQVQRIGDDTWQESVTVPNGTNVRYRIIVSSTGDVPVTNLVIGDVLPSGVTYIDNTLVRDNNAVAYDNQFFSAAGINIGSLNNGSSTTFAFNAIVGSTDSSVPCVQEQLRNISNADGDILAPISDDAIVTKLCTPLVPNYTIVKQVQRIGDDGWQDSITVPNGTNVRYRIVINSTGTAPVTNLVIGDTLPSGVSYIDNTLLRDNNAVTNDEAFFTTDGINIGTLNNGSSTTFVFNAIVGSATPGAPCTEDALRNVSNADGDILAPISDDATVTRNCEGPTPEYSCDVLTATSLGNRNFRFNVLYTANGGATLSTSTFSFGDNSSNFVTSSVSATHQYAQDGTYTASVNLTFMVDGVAHTVTSEGCNVTISSITPPDHCTVPGKENLLANDPNCVPDEHHDHCTIPGKENLLDTDPNCKNDDEKAEELPNTGPGSVLGLFAGSTIAGTLGYRKWAIRRQKR